jgi:hypothetical protein
MKKILTREYQYGFTLGKTITKDTFINPPEDLQKPESNRRAEIKERPCANTIELFLLTKCCVSQPKYFI